MEEDSRSFPEWAAWWRTARSGWSEEARAEAAGIGLQKGESWLKQVLERLRGTDAAVEDQNLVEELRSIVLAIIRQSKRESIVTTLGSASAELRADKEIVLEAVRADPRTLGVASDGLRDDSDVVLEAVERDGCSLQDASETLRGNKTLVLQAVRQNGEALGFASPALQTDKDLVLEAAKRCQTGFGLVMITKPYAADREVMLEVVNYRGSALAWASAEIKADKEVVFAAVSNDGEALQFANGICRADREVVLVAVNQSSSALRWASKELRADKDIILLSHRRARNRAINRSETFQRAYRSFVAVQGENAPILSVSMTYGSFCPSDEHADKTLTGFQCQISLLSGLAFTCFLADGDSSSGSNARSGDSPERATESPILDDLARILVSELPNYTKVAGQERVFINFVVGHEGDSLVASPWDCARPLTHFL